MPARNLVRSTSSFPMRLACLKLPIDRQAQVPYPARGPVALSAILENHFVSALSFAVFSGTAIYLQNHAVFICDSSNADHGGFITLLLLCPQNFSRVLIPALFPLSHLHCKGQEG
jgi:hypothetical protein